MVKINRNYEIVFSNVILCLMVVLIHLVSELRSATPTISTIPALFYWRLSAFVVQGFIFLSAFKIFAGNEITDFKRYYISKLKKIVVPYLIWNLIYYLFFCYVLDYFPFSITELLKYILNGTLVSPFYFIIIILQFYALIPLMQAFHRKLPPLTCLAFSLILTLTFKIFSTEHIYSDRVFLTYFIYFSLGAMYGLYYNKITKLLLKYKYHIFSIFTLLGTLNLYFTYKVFFQNFTSVYWEYLHFLYCIFAIISVITVGLYVKENKIINILNKITFSIYLSHCLFIFIINDIFSSYDFSLYEKFFIRSVFVYTITIVLCLIYSKITNIKRLK